MDVIFCAQLTCIVVAPDKDSIHSVDHVDEATAHLKNGHFRILKVPLKLRPVVAGLEEGREPLDRPDEAGHRLIVLNESIGAPGA